MPVFGSLLITTPYDVKSVVAVNDALALVVTENAFHLAAIDAHIAAIDVICFKIKLGFSHHTCRDQLYTEHDITLFLLFITLKGGKFCFYIYCILQLYSVYLLSQRLRMGSTLLMSQKAM